MKMRELLSDESKWTQGYLAQEKETSGFVDVNDPKAARWCLIGAVKRCYGLEAQIEGNPDHPILTKIRQKLGLKAGQFVSDIATWNDDPSRTFVEVKTLVGELDI